MTSEEHIKNLESLISHFNDLINGATEIFDKEQAKKDIETFNAAIEALKLYTWISASQKSPISDVTDEHLRYKHYLVLTEDGCAYTARRHDNKWLLCGSGEEILNVTDWTNIPKRIF